MFFGSFPSCCSSCYCSCCCSSSHCSSSCCCKPTRILQVYMGVPWEYHKEKVGQRKHGARVVESPPCMQCNTEMHTQVHTCMMVGATTKTKHTVGVQRHPSHFFPYRYPFPFPHFPFSFSSFFPPLFIPQPLDILPYHKRYPPCLKTPLSLQQHSSYCSLLLLPRSLSASHPPQVFRSGMGRHPRPMGGV